MVGKGGLRERWWLDEHLREWRAELRGRMARVFVTSSPDTAFAGV